MASINTIYLFAVFVSFLVCYLLHLTVPELNPVLKFFIIPFAVLYIITWLGSSTVQNTLTSTEGVFDYLTTNTYGAIDNLNYFYVYPPILFVLVLFIIFLFYQRD